MYMCIYIYIHMYVCTYVCTYVFKYIYMHICVCVNSFSRKCFMCCNLRNMNQLVLCSGHSGDSLTVIPPLPIELEAGISSFRQRGAFVKEKVQDGHMCQKKAWNK